MRQRNNKTKKVSAVANIFDKFNEDVEEFVKRTESSQLKRKYSAKDIGIAKMNYLNQSFMLDNQGIPYFKH